MLFRLCPASRVLSPGTVRRFAGRWRWRRPGGGRALHLHLHDGVAPPRHPQHPAEGGGAADGAGVRGVDHAIVRKGVGLAPDRGCGDLGEKKKKGKEKKRKEERTFGICSCTRMYSP